MFSDKTRAVIMECRVDLSNGGKGYFNYAVLCVAYFNLVEVRMNRHNG